MTRSSAYSKQFSFVLYCWVEKRGQKARFQIREVDHLKIDKKVKGFLGCILGVPLCSREKRCTAVRLFNSTFGV
jgi:hypothetical protein